jgi:hypothetical protein
MNSVVTQQLKEVPLLDIVEFAGCRLVHAVFSGLWRPAAVNLVSFSKGLNGRLYRLGNRLH